MPRLQPLALVTAAVVVLLSTNSVSCWTLQSPTVTAPGWQQSVSSRISPQSTAASGRRRRQQQLILHFEASGPSLDVNNSSTSQEPSATTASDDDDEAEASVVPDFPWSDVQAWTLQDQLARYTVQVPVKETMKVYTLWRSMTLEVPELAGYPLDFLLQKASTIDDNLVYGLDILPYLDDFVFENAGGLAGRVYGVAGVADGTRIQTTPVGNVQVTVPRGFVQTADGSVLYELGQPTTTGGGGGGAGTSGTGTGETSLLTNNGVIRAVSEEASAWAGSLTNVKDELKDAEIDADLVRLGGMAAVLLSGALAVDMLSHHLTVNVFWV